MKTLITGHRLYKLECYDIEWIKHTIHLVFQDTFLGSTSIGLSGMASGVDLWFCETCLLRGKRYIACIPFDGQQNTMDKESAVRRDILIKSAVEVWKCRNSLMVEKADAGLVVWDGNKGGTHNVFQQLVENKKPFVWINPVSETLYEIN